MSLRDIYETGFDESTGKTIAAENCPECTGRLLTEGGEISCGDCGLIIDEQRIDPGPEWRDFADEATRERTGAPLTPARHDRGLSTEIGFGNTDANGNVLSGRKRGQLTRLRREHTRARFNSTADRNLAYACSEIRRIASDLDLPPTIIDEASTIYRAAQRESLIMGRSIEAIAAGSVYAACRCRGYRRSVEEIAATARCTVDHVELGYQVVNRELGLAAGPVRVSGLLPQLASDCDIPDSVRQRARELAAIAEDTGIANGRHPGGVAAACLYKASEEQEAGITQAELAGRANVTAVTLRARYRELQTELTG